MAARIARLPELDNACEALVQAEAIFWVSSGTKRFESAEAREAFWTLWFGRYIEHAPDEFFLALGEDGAVEGYLAGARMSGTPPLPGPDYFALFPADLIARFPAHIHVNIRADRRGDGVGADLVRSFAAHCRSLDLPGFHAVTGLGTGSAAFFERCGLAPRAAADWHGSPLAFLGARLAG